MRFAHVVAAVAALASLAAAGEAPAQSAQVLSINDARMAEGTFGARSLTFRVALSEVSQSAISVSYRTQNETARAGEDYELTQGTLQLAPGETSKTIEVSVRGDRKVEPDEFFSLILYAPTNAQVAEPAALAPGRCQRRLPGTAEENEVSRAPRLAAHVQLSNLSS